MKLVCPSREDRSSFKMAQFAAIAQFAAVAAIATIAALVLVCPTAATMP